MVKSEEWRVKSEVLEESEEGEKMIMVKEKTIRELMEKLKELLEEGD